LNIKFLIILFIYLAGRIVNQVLGTTGQVLSSVVVGNYQQNMTFTGISQTLDNGDIIKQFSYSPPAGSSQTGNTYVNIVFDTQGNPVSATVINPASTPAPTIPTTTSTITNASPTITTTTIMG
jgi:hypothetical protein